MFCPKCGKAEQLPETYCRQCGIFLPDLSKSIKRESSPEPALSETQPAFQPVSTAKLLDQADFNDLVPASVTEDITKHLAEKIGGSS